MRWQCPKCYSRLELRVIPYYVLNLIALAPLIVALMAFDPMLRSAETYLGILLAAIYLVWWIWIIRSFAPIQLSSSNQGWGEPANPNMHR